MSTKQLKGAADLTGILTMASSVTIGFVVMVIILTLGGSVLLQMRNTAEAGGNNTNVWNIINNGSAGLLNLSSQSTNIGLVIGIVIILLILVGGLGFFLYTRQE